MEQKSSPNFTSGRNGQTIKAVVVHKAEGSKQSAIDWLSNPESQVSAHFVVGLDGSVTQLVSTDDTAWHCGVVVNPTWAGMIAGVNPNEYTVGIELEGFAADPMPLEQFAALVNLVSDILIDQKLLPSEETIVYHHEIDGAKPCPGTLLPKPYLIEIAMSCYQATVVADFAPQPIVAPAGEESAPVEVDGRTAQRRGRV